MKILVRIVLFFNIIALSAYKDVLITEFRNAISVSFSAAAKSAGDKNIEHSEFFKFFNELDLDQKKCLVSEYSDFLTHFALTAEADLDAQALVNDLFVIKNDNKSDTPTIVMIKNIIDNSTLDMIVRIKNVLLSRIIMPSFSTKKYIDHLKSTCIAYSGGVDFLYTIVPFESILSMVSQPEIMAAIIINSFFDEYNNTEYISLINIINHAEKPVIIDCYADWCPPCKVMKPIFEKLSTKYGDSYTFITVDIAQAPQFMSDYAIQCLPTFLCIKNGKIVARYVGSMPEEELEKKIHEAYNGDCK